MMQQQDLKSKIPKDTDFFTDYGEANRYKILEIVGKGSYGVVCAAIDTHTREKVAIKKITNIFEHMSDAVRILREIKLLRLLRHPDIVDIKRIMLPPSRRDFKDIYVVFELMESDLHQVIKANDDLTCDHQRFFIYQMLRALKYMHTANVYHRDLKPKNILANANCKLKICDLGLARVAFNDTPTTIFWTDYVATRWYRAPELCGSFSSKYTPAIDIWSIGCIFAEVLTGKPLFPGKSVVHQLDLITDLLGTPSADTISGVRNEKARKYLNGMRKKRQVPFTDKFPNTDPLALKLLHRLLAFDPKGRPSAEQALADPYFKGLAKLEREPSCQSISKLEFEFERRKLTKEDIKELIYREILEYHPQLLKDYVTGNGGTSFLYPSAIGYFKKQFAYLEENVGNSGSVTPPVRKHVSLPRPSVNSSSIPAKEESNVSAPDNWRISGEMPRGLPDASSENISKFSRPLPRVPNGHCAFLSAKPGRVVGPVLPYEKTRHANDPSVSKCYVPSISPHCFNKIRKGADNAQTIATQLKQHSQQYAQNKPPNGGMNIDIDYKVQRQQYSNGTGAGVDMDSSNPYSKSEVKPSLLNSQIAMNANLFQAQFGATGSSSVGMSAHRDIGQVQVGLS